MSHARIIAADVFEGLAQLEDGSVHTCVTSPPYWGLRDYGHGDQIGLEKTPEEYVAKLVEVFREVRRVLRDDGTVWLNLGDSYNGVGRGDKANGLQVAARAAKQRTVHHLKPKDLCGIPWRVAFALQSDGWWLRSDIIWHKPNPMPESVTDRPTSAHEYIFLLSKSARYFYDAEAIAERLAPASVDRLTQNVAAQNGSVRANGGVRPDRPMKAVRRNDKQRGHSRRHAGFNDRWDAMTKEEQQSLGRNKRDVWTVATKPFPGAHFAVFNPELITPCVLAGSPVGGTVLDPFSGSGTTGIVAVENGRNYVGIELNPDYVEMSRQRIGSTTMNLFQEVAHANH